MSKQRIAMQEAADAGDTLADAALLDQAEEDGLPPFEPYRRGQVVQIYTATHYYRGTLVGEDYEVFAITRVTQTFSTGRMEEFYASGKGSEDEAFPADVVLRVRKGGIIAMSNWPAGAGRAPR